MRCLGRYLLNLLIATDQWFNALLGGGADMTLSGRMGLYHDECAFCRWVCRWLERIDPGHCRRAIEADRIGQEIVGWRGSLVLLAFYATFILTLTTTGD